MFSFFCIILFIFQILIIKNSNSLQKLDQLIEKSEEDSLNLKHFQDLFAVEFKQLISKSINSNRKNGDGPESNKKNNKIFSKNALQSSANSRLIDSAFSLAVKLKETHFQNASKASLRAPFEFCPFKQITSSCDPNNKFYSFDGSCNNLNSPWFGKAETPYKRFIQPAYEDGFSIPRSMSRTGRTLPNPRQVSRILFGENSLMDNRVTHLTAMFGQFLTHDLTSASISTDSSGNGLDCHCSNGNQQCMPIIMPSNENIMRMSCMRFTRSSAAFSSFDCNLGHREQLNLLTSYIDGTQIYGSSDQRSKSLRQFQGGLLKSSRGVSARPVLLKANDGSCRDANDFANCFSAGEGRVNENLALSSVQMLFMREHNRIATDLSNINPFWSDEQLFNEARRILIACYQNIIYNEFVPAIIGTRASMNFDLLTSNTDNYYTGYRSDINPSISNEFAAAAFRFGHTLVRSKLGRFNMNNQMMGPSVNLSDIIFRPVEAYNSVSGGIDSLFLSMINEPAGKYDTNVADALQNHLFEFRMSDGSVIATDLAAANINRGRDHGIPSYNSFKERCGFGRAQTFDDLSNVMSRDKIDLLRLVYDSVDDIDFYVGGLSESPNSDSLVGPTFACVIANQFRDLKKGDRLYFENGPSSTSFSIEQLREIRKSSLARLICDNFDLNEIQPNVFIQSSAATNNAKIPCFFIQKMDLTKWQNV